MTSEQRTYEVVRGDSLWLIAWTVFGDGNRWLEIFAANQALIEDEIKKRFRKPKPDPQNWIFPGTVLAIPQNVRPEGGKE